MSQPQLLKRVCEFMKSNAIGTALATIVVGSACLSLRCSTPAVVEEHCAMEGVTEGACSADMVFVPGSNCCIDRYEASIDEASAARSRSGDVPASNVSWETADAACRAADKELCPQEVWESACTAGGALRYPYGDEYDPAACNAEDRSASPVPAGSMEGCEGGLEGLFDMSGNVIEWTASCEPSGRCTARGGAYNLFDDDLACALDVTASTAGFETVGFRCCRVAEPER
jgi:hypothetical protein